MLPREAFLDECPYDAVPFITDVAGRPMHAVRLKTNYGMFFIRVDPTTFTRGRFTEFIDDIISQGEAYANLSRHSILHYDSARPGIVTLINPSLDLHQDLPFCREFLDVLGSLLS